MSVLIKGLSIPKEDTMLLRINTNGEVYVFGGYATKIFDAIYIPAHGDLIDRDEQIERAWRLKLNTRELIAEMLNTATVVIPAERNEYGET